MSILSLSPLSESEYPLWDSSVDSSPQGTIFNTTRWAAIVKEVFDVQHSIYAVLQNEELVGGISLFHKRKAGLRVSTRLPLTPYNGILLRSSRGEKEQKAATEQKEIFDLILERLEKEFHFIHFALHPTVDDLRPFTWRRWYTLPQYTYVNSLTNLDQTWSYFSSSLRRKINRAEERKFVISQKTDSTFLLKFQEMSYAKAGLKPVLSLSTFKRYCDAVSAANLLRIYSVADPSGTIHAERAVVVDRDRAYDWIAGTNLEIEDASGSHLLVWEILKRLSSEGIRTFDFLGANTPGIMDFKRAFGGELTSYFEVRRFSSRLVQALNFLNQKWRHSQRKT